MPLEVIAEIHPQHGGSLANARELIRAARLAGATVAKFQLYDARALLGEEWSYLEPTFDDAARWKRWCEEDEIEFMASPFDLERVRWCEELGMNRYKIASRTVVGDRALCEHVIATGKETIVSLGMWEQPDKPFGELPTVRYLYCKASYPTYYEELDDFPEDFPAAGLAGHSDHCFGIEVCLLAIARGATIVEKHLTLDKARTRPTERAHICSMTPAELDELVRIGGAIQRTRAAIQTARTRQ